MIWELVKRETAWREVYGYIAVVAAMSLALPEYAGSIFIFVVGLCWMRSLPAERASLFQAGLPIAATDLFLSRALAFGALIWLPAAAGTLMLLLTGHLENAGGMLTGGAAFSVMVLAALSHRVRELAGSHFFPPIAMAILFATAWPISRYAPRNLVAIVCSVVCVLLFAAIWFRLPLSFEVAGSKSGPLTFSDPSHDVAARRAPTPSSLKAWIPVARCLFPINSFMFLPVIVMQNFGGQWFYGASMALFPVIGAISKLGWLGGLPISRGRLLTLMLTPWMLTLTLNLLAGSLLFPVRTTIQFDYLGRNVSSIRVPLEYWSLAPDGEPPVIQAPWHEKWMPRVETLAGMRVYNPYSVGPANTHRFMEWQFRRATVPVYGQALDFNDYRRVATLRPLNQQTRFAVVNIGACLCWLLLLFNGLLCLMHWRTKRLVPRVSQYAAFLLLLPMLVPLFLEISVRFPGGSLGTALLNAGLLRVLGALPDGLTPVIVAAAVPLGLLWWSALRLFDGVEPQPADPAARA